MIKLTNLNQFNIDRSLCQDGDTMFDDELALMDDQVVLGDEGSVDDPENESNHLEGAGSNSARLLPST